MPWEPSKRHGKDCYSSPALAMATESGDQGSPEYYHHFEDAFDLAMATESGDQGSSYQS